MRAANQTWEMASVGAERAFILLQLVSLHNRADQTCRRTGATLATWKKLRPKPG